MVALPVVVPGAEVSSGPGCEAVSGGPLAEPVSAVTSLAFVVAGVVIVLRGRRRPTGDPRPGTGGTVDGRVAGSGRGTVPAPTLGFATLVASVGVGSVIQHGPDPAWSDVAHDLPLLATLAFVAADAAADLSGRRRRTWWWAGPTAALLPVVVLLPRTGDGAQVAVAVVAVALTVVRAARRAALRPRIGAALMLLATGAAVGTLSRSGGPLCDPTSLWQGHGAWHVLAAAALVVLAPTLTQPEGRHRGT